MKKKEQNPLYRVMMITLIMLITFGCGDGGGDSDHYADGVGDQTKQSDDELNRLVCEEMLSEDFLSSYSLAIETDNRFENPIEGHEEIATFCTVKEDGNWVSEVTALNGNSATYDSLLADFQLEHEMVEENAVGMKSAYTYHDDELDLLTFIFLCSNNATTVTIVQLNPMGLEETRALAQEIDRNLPDVDPLENTAPDYQCPDMISESDLTAIFDKNIAYASLTPNNISNDLLCTYNTPDSEELSDMFSGEISLYCDPAPGQTTPQQRFQIMEDAILKGHSDLFGNKMIYEDVRALSEIGSKAYYYTVKIDTEYPQELDVGSKLPVLMFLHHSKNCYIELQADDYSNSDLDQQLIEVAKRIESNL